MLLCSLIICSCKRSERDEQVFQFVQDRMATPYYAGGAHLDTLLKHFDRQLDSAKRLTIQQRFIPWGRPPIGFIELKEMASMKLDDGRHYYLIINLFRQSESRAFNYLVEVFDGGSDLWLRQFFMYETNDPILKNVSIKKKKGGAVWLVGDGRNKGEFDGERLIRKSKFPPF